MPRRRVWNAAARGCGGTLKPLNRIPILCTASILYLFIIGRNLSTKQTLAAARHAGSGECGQMTTWNAIRIKPWHPFSGLCWRCTYLPVLTLGMQGYLCCQTGIRQKRESAPWFVRSRAGLRAIRHQADEGHCPCLQWSCTAFRWASEGRCRPYLPVTRECATDAAGGLPML